MATVEQDTFTRANAGSWGTASNGDSWAFPGVAETYSITSNKGLEGSLNGGDWHGILGANTTATPNLLVRVKVDDTGNMVGVFGRYTNASGVNGYRMGLYAGQITADKYINGTRTGLGSAVNFSYDTAHYYWIHAIMNGTSLTCAVWVDGGSEPAPQYSITDSSVSGAGKVGLSAFMNSANNSYDSFLATDNQSAINKDIATRFRQKSAAQLKDIVTRFRQKSADQLKDIQTRFRQKSADVLKDVVTRFRQMSAAQLKDISSRFRLKSADQLKDIKTRFLQKSANQLKDIASRFRQKSADQLKDVATRFIQALAAQRLKDVATRFLQKSADQLKDIKTRFLQKSANQLKDIQTRFLQKSASQLKDISSRFRQRSANQLRDIASRFIQVGVGSVINRDISTRFVQVALINLNATVYIRSGLATAYVRSGQATDYVRSGVATVDIRKD